MTNPIGIGINAGLAYAVGTGLCAAAALTVPIELIILVTNRKFSFLSDQNLIRVLNVSTIIRTGCASVGIYQVSSVALSSAVLGVGLGCIAIVAMLVLHIFIARHFLAHARA